MNDEVWWKKNTPQRGYYYVFTMLAAFWAILWTKLVMWGIFAFMNEKHHCLVTFSTWSTKEHLSRIPNPAIILYEVFNRPNAELLREIYLGRSKIAKREDAQAQVNGTRGNNVADFQEGVDGSCHLFGMTIFVVVSLYLDVAVGAQGVFFMIDALVQALGGFYAYTGRDMYKTSTHWMSIFLCIGLAPFCPLYVNWLVWVCVILFLFMASLIHRKQTGSLSKQEDDNSTLPQNSKYRYAMLAQASGSAPVENPGILARMFTSKAKAHPSNQAGRDFSIP